MLKHSREELETMFKNLDTIDVSMMTIFLDIRELLEIIAKIKNIQ